VTAVRPGKVWLVGAGPGDPELLTRKAYALLSEASVVAYDELVPPPILAIAHASAERIPVGRRANGCRHHEGRIHPLVLERALSGQDVVRLKGGDPLVFGRGGEEAAELDAHGIPFGVVPGITAALGAAASIGVALTHREHASMVTLATAHAAHDGQPLDLPLGGTLVLYMGLSRLEAICAALVERGRPPATPAALVSHATLPTERLVRGTLADLPARVRDAGVEPPAILIVGEVVALAAGGRLS
jgi:uroporphyrin-III C-methyltransferase/precorrin-2 dehydrogenase/sirohydrochlorin ferrochelatase